MESVIADPGLPAIASNDLRTRRRQLGVVGEPVQAHPQVHGEHQLQRRTIVAPRRPIADYVAGGLVAYTQDRKRATASAV